MITANYFRFTSFFGIIALTGIVLLDKIKRDRTEIEVLRGMQLLFCCFMFQYFTNYFLKLKMAGNRFYQLRDFRVKRKYEILLVSFFILLFGDILSPEGFNIMPFLLLQNVAASLILFYGKRKWRIPLHILFVSIISIEIISLIFKTELLKPVFAIVYIIYFIFLSTEVYGQIWRTKEVTIEVISAVLCGFIILGFTGAYVFTFTEIFEWGSFANLSEGSRRFSDLIYFSFISILGIGYGDIIPLTALAKKLTLFIAIVGHFYNVIVIGIIIGKYISKSK